MQYIKPKLQLTAMTKLVRWAYSFAGEKNRIRTPIAVTIRQPIGGYRGQATILKFTKNHEIKNIHEI